MRTLSIELRDQLFAQLTTEARRRRLTQSSLIRKCIENALHADKSGTTSCFDPARDLAGTIKGLPLNLAAKQKT